jgi:anti-anti-sigma factor
VGSVDALTAEKITDFLGAQVDGGQTQLVVDLEQVDFMSSAGLRTILVILRKSRQQGGDLRLAAAQVGVKKTLEMSGFTRILNAYATAEEAAASFQPQ